MEIINLDMTPSTVTPNAHAGQYDASRTVRFMLKNGGVPFTLAGTETITAEITRSDNTEVTVNVTNTSSNYVDVVFDDTVCTVKGLYACELRLKDSDGFDIGSKNFALLVQRDPYDGAGIHVVTVGPADICTFETTLAEPYHSVLVNVLATGGNGTPDNPNPINGYTEANITRCGVNLFDIPTWLDSISTPYTVDNGVYTFQTSIRLNTPFVLSDTDKPVTVSVKSFGGTAAGQRVQLLNSSDTVVATADKNHLTVTATASKVRLDYGLGGSYILDNCIVYDNATGNTYTIAFGQTVYGGVLDVTRGKLTVKTARLDLSDLNYSYNTTAGVAPYFYASVSGVKYEGPFFSTVYNSRCNIYTCTKRDAPAFVDKTYCFDGSAPTVLQIQIKDLDYTDPVTFKASLTGAYIVYELATPFDIDLTPEVISAVVGTNNVFADCGETTVKYLKAGG